MAATAAEAVEITGNTMLSTVAERRMATKQPRINSAEQLEELLQPTAKPEHGRIFLSRATEPKLERATRARADSKVGHATLVHAGNRQAPGIVPETALVVVRAVAAVIA